MARSKPQCSALKEGASDYLTKPVKPEELTHRIEQAIWKSVRMTTEIANLHVQLREKFGLSNFIGTSPKMRGIFEKIHRVANARTTVLIIGETGTGKDLVAQAIHHNSPRAEKPFVPVNCSASALKA